jgi:TonB family protein
MLIALTLRPVFAARIIVGVRQMFRSVRMRLRPAVTFALFLLFLLETGVVMPQEPAFLSGSMAVRYEEARGVFHYVFPCKLPPGDAPQSSGGATSVKDKASALCWPVLVGRFRTVDSKSESPVLVAGILMVSDSLVRFVPNDAKNANLMPDTPPTDIAFQYDAGHVVEAVLHTKEGAYGFTFQAMCIGCTLGTPPLDTKKTAQLEGEYRDFENSLTQFGTVFERINELASQIRFGITPKNQPTLKDPPEAMGLYSDLNQRFAELCPEAAKSCVRSYAKYQACKSGNFSTECGDPPGCSAFCALTPGAFRDLKASFCKSKFLDSAALVPDWSGVARKMDAAREAKGPIDPKTMHLAAAPPGPPLDFMGKPTQPDNPCSVESTYATAMMYQVTSAGMAHMTPSSPTLVDGKLNVAPNIIAGNKISGMIPQYPAVAKAGHVEGVVVLQATISRQGSIEKLQVLSGPPLLVQAALDAVKTWQYRPYLLNGEAVEVEAQITVNFTQGAKASGRPPESTPPN